MAGFYASKGAAYTPGELRSAYLREARKAEETLLLRDRGRENAWVEIELGAVFAALYEQRGTAADQRLVAETALRFRRASTTHLRLYAGAKELLASLRRSGAGVYLLSNAQSLFTLPELEALGLADCFDGIFLSSDAGCRKPDPRFFRKLLTETGLSGADCLMIGNDPLCDKQGAESVGMDCWCIRSGLSPKGFAEAYDQRGMDLRKLLRYLR